MPLPSRCAEFAPLVKASLGDPRISIALLDGKVDTQHPCFAGANLYQLPSPGQCNGDAFSAQATHTASISFGQCDSVLPGLAPLCTGYLIATHGQLDSGAVVSHAAVLSAAIRVALNQGVHIITISNGECQGSDEDLAALNLALAECYQRGVLVVVAAGKSSDRKRMQLHQLASSDHVLAVACQSAEASRSASGAYAGMVKHANNALLARGHNLAGACAGGGAVLAAGANGAAMLVSSVAALLLSLQLQQGFVPYPLAIRDVLLNSSEPLEQFVAGRVSPYRFGRMNAQAALSRIGQWQGEPGEPLAAQNYLEPWSGLVLAGSKPFVQALIKH